MHDCSRSIHASFYNSHLVSLGDFNCPVIDWSLLIGSILEDRFIGLCSEVHLEQLVGALTGVTDTTAKVLDLILTSNPVIFEQVTLLNSLRHH